MPVARHEGAEPGDVGSRRRSSASSSSSTSIPFSCARSNSASHSLQLELVGGDERLAAVDERDAVRGRRTPLSRARRACTVRLEAARRVVDPAVDHPAVVAGLVRGEGSLLLEQHERRAGTALEELPGRRQPDDAAADDAEVVRHPRDQAGAEDERGAGAVADRANSIGQRVGHWYPVARHARPARAPPARRRRAPAPRHRSVSRRAARRSRRRGRPRTRPRRGTPSDRAP